MGSHDLHDGISIRLVRRDDEERLAEHFRSLSPASVYFRFFGPRRGLSSRELAGVTEIDFLDLVPVRRPTTPTSEPAGCQ